MNKGIAQGVAFSGNLVLVEPYILGNEAYLHIKGHVEADNLHWYSAWWWSCYLVTDTYGTILFSDCRAHSSAPWTSHDEADDDFVADLGSMPSGDLVGQVELLGYEGGTVAVPPGVDFVLCDIEQFIISNGGPSPECSPGTTKCDGMGNFCTCNSIGKWEITEYNSPRCENSESKNIWKWVAIGGLGLSAIFLSRQKRK